MGIKNNYYIGSFFWSSLQKVLNAILGFISVPLFLGVYGKADYGILAIATACNGYMHLLDLGMNTGAIRFFSQWLAEGKKDLIYRVARTNITFYIIIASINALGLLLLALFGQPLFSVTADEFTQLQICLVIIALFSVFSWVTTAFNQLLVADKQMAFTMQVQCVQTILKTLLVFVVLWADITLTSYFFWLTFILALLIVPYAIKCRKDGLIDSMKPATYWSDFRVVLMFSLSIFALSLFQMSATQTRPIILSIFALNGAESVAEFKIIEVIPTFIILIGGTFSSIFLPKTSEMITRGNQDEISRFAYKWTIFTTIIACILCFPFLLGADEILSAYVGSEYSTLSIWLIIWLICVLCQIHSTPTNALILACGKTKVMVYVAGVACLISMVINGVLAETIGVGSAVVGYAVYIAINLVVYYAYYYSQVLQLSITKILYSFLASTVYGIIAYVPTYYLFASLDLNIIPNERINYLIIFTIKAMMWLLMYATILIFTRTVKYRNKQILTKYDVLDKI